ncbi:hypothetical protein IFM89_032017 [Coptis chinensis]|uniref:Pantothenate kinase n=1 Tax=Coptis chinensis TaxID=261450 RepID=A0A835H0R3_9MAGN|nr:hypothetical protein IFM89_032017 [Coptis chinensis]
MSDPSSSRPQLDLSGAAIQGNVEEKDPTILLPNQSQDFSHLSLDIGGSLIKLVYFSRHEDQPTEDERSCPILASTGVTHSNSQVGFSASTSVDTATASSQ